MPLAKLVPSSCAVMVVWSGVAFITRKFVLSASPPPPQPNPKNTPPNANKAKAFVSLLTMLLLQQKYIFPLRCWQEFFPERRFAKFCKEQSKDCKGGNL